MIKRLFIKVRAELQESRGKGGSIPEDKQWQEALISPSPERAARAQPSIARSYGLWVGKGT